MICYRNILSVSGVRQRPITAMLLAEAAELDTSRRPLKTQLTSLSPSLRPRWRRIVLAVAAFFRADIDHAIDHARSEAGT